MFWKLKSVGEVECALRHKDANFVLLDFTVAINIFLLEIYVINLSYGLN